MKSGVTIGLIAGTFALTYLLTNWIKKKRAIHEITSHLEAQFHISNSKLQEITLKFEEELRKGLVNENSTVPNLVSFVDKLPTGDEKGDYLSLDLGGTNFRISLVQLYGRSGLTRIKQKKVQIPEKLKIGSGIDLFQFVADCVESFIKEEKVDQHLKMGFTFSFPVKQLSINSGSIMGWSKDFKCNDVVGSDPVKLLQDEFKKKGIKIEVTALVNDTVGTLISNYYKEPDSKVGVILGTGSNAAYIEKTKSIEKNKKLSSKNMIINVEWGAFDNEKTVLPFNKYDELLDFHSQNVGLQRFEKLISGYYLGELVRLVLLDLIAKNLIFSPDCLDLLSVPHKFDTAFMSRIERDFTSNLDETELFLKETFGVLSNYTDRTVLKRLCHLISLRSARLAAAGIVGIIHQMNSHKKSESFSGCTVAIDGSLYELYPNFPNRMKDALYELLDKNANLVQLELAKDASSVGAAVIAAMY